MATPEGTSIPLDPRNRPIPIVWDQTLDGGEGQWRAVTPADLGGSAPLSAPSSNIPRTLAPTGPAATLVAGVCQNGFWLRNEANSTGDLYYGDEGVDADEGDVLEPGEGIFIPCIESSSVYVLASAADTYYRGIRY